MIYGFPEFAVLDSPDIAHTGLVPHTIDAIEAYLDRRLDIGPDTDRTGNGLLVRGSPNVRRIGAALNTSFAAIDAAEAQQVDLMIVHHAPWAEIDMHLRAPKLAKLSALGISLYAAHESLESLGDRATRRYTCRVVGIDGRAV